MHGWRGPNCRGRPPWPPAPNKVPAGCSGRAGKHRPPEGVGGTAGACRPPLGHAPSPVAAASRAPPLASRARPAPRQLRPTGGPWPPPKRLARRAPAGDGVGRRRLLLAWRCSAFPAPSGHAAVRPAGVLRAGLRRLRAAGRAGHLGRRAALREPAAGRAAGAQGGLPGEQPVPARGRPRELPGRRPERQPPRRSRPAQRLGRPVQLGLRLRLLLLQHAHHHRRLRLHHPPLGWGQGLLHLLRTAGGPLHHAAADGYCAAPCGRADLWPAGVPGPEVGLHPADALLRAPPPAGGRGAGGLLPGARSHFLLPGGVLELPGRLLLLLHLPVHHRVGGLRPRRAAGAALPPPLQDLGHSVPAAGPPGHAPAAPDLPQGCRAARPLRPGLAAPGPTPRRPPAHPGGPGAPLGASRESARQAPAQCRGATQLRLHLQIAKRIGGGGCLCGETVAGLACAGRTSLPRAALEGLPRKAGCGTPSGPLA